MVMAPSKKKPAVRARSTPIFRGGCGRGRSLKKPETREFPAFEIG